MGTKAPHHDADKKKALKKDNSVNLELFVAGRSDQINELAASLKKSLMKDFPYPYTFKVYDILVDRRMAAKRRVIATPTIIKINPPAFRIIGDFSRTEEIVEKIVLLKDSADRDDA